MLRRAMSKQGQDVAKEREAFLHVRCGIKGCVANGIYRRGRKNLLMRLRLRQLRIQ